eukprot:gnl/TRDRNA2_/TRDRNA2_43581_c0_seq1.p1 gnl/TRDRNA2_/TRDRNA2_43581_c0~~gnl/TRDRNA2_/TRDRNA2_43581_c0_seq1.p1  ORF type:complete len:356 (+),score=49.80 gnl/TRDRNA2_/TRDRNA2_43581_c0_seq1:80-1147(+)
MDVVIFVGVPIAFVAADIVINLVRVLLFPPIRVVERGTGKPVAECRPFDEHAKLFLVWSTFTGSRLLCSLPGFLQYLEDMTRRAGEKMDAPESVALIDKFVEGYGVDLSEVKSDMSKFKTMNEFFCRQLKDGARPIMGKEDLKVAVSPADCRLLCFDEIDEAARLVVKGHGFSVASMVGASDGQSKSMHPGLAKLLDGSDASGGSAKFSVVVCRMSPTDYHRYHFPFDCAWRRVADLKGEYHSVSNPAVGSSVDVFGRNRRVVLVADTQAFGPVGIVLVGASKVGGIELTAPEIGDQHMGIASKGAELGLFKYGGSTVVLIFRHGMIDFDEELRRNSRARIETLVRMGSLLGRAR